MLDSQVRKAPRAIVIAWERVRPILSFLTVAGCHGGAATPDAVLRGDATLAPDAQTTCLANGIPGSCIAIAQCYGSRTQTAGLCPETPGITCCSPRFADGIACDPVAVPTPNDGLVEAPGDVGCPSGMAKVATFCMDRFEASLVQDTGSWSPYFPPLTNVVRAVSIRGAVPQAYIKQTEAAAACTAAGKRLCSDVEWLRACQGPSLDAYPYGNTHQPGTCNDARTVDPAVELYGTSDPWIQDHLDSPCLDQLPDGLAKNGAHTGCTTPEGVFDLMGNLREWTDDPSGTLRGGDFVMSSGCADVITQHDTFFWDYTTGFRCCATPTP